MIICYLVDYYYGDEITPDMITGKYKFENDEMYIQINLPIRSLIEKIITKILTGKSYSAEYINENLILFKNVYYYDCKGGIDDNS